MERIEVENLVLGNVRHLTVPLTGEGEVYVRKMTWSEFEQFTKALSEYLAALQEKPKEGEELKVVSGLMSDLLLGNIVDVPVEIVRRLVLAVSYKDPNGETHLKAEELKGFDFDDVIEIAGVALRVHFSDNKKVKSFFGLVGGFLSVAGRRAPTEMTETLPD